MWHIHFSILGKNPYLSVCLEVMSESGKQMVISTGTVHINMSLVLVESYEPGELCGVVFKGSTSNLKE
jgi:hypothetical protein